MDRPDVINAFAEKAEYETRERLAEIIRDLARRLPDADLLSAYMDINVSPDSGHTEPAETCDLCKEDHNG